MEKCRKDGEIMLHLNGSRTGWYEISFKKKCGVLKIAALLLIFSVVSGTQSFCVNAADFYRSEYVSELKPGKTKSLKGYKEQIGGFQPGIGFVETNDPMGNSLRTTYDYKIRIPRDCVWNITFVSSQKGIDISLKGKDKGYIRSFTSKGKRCVINAPIKKGTYYISSNVPRKIKCRYQLEKMKDYGNYCVGKAKTINPDKQVKVAQLGKCNYVKWYKIKLTKCQAIVIKGKVFDRTDETKLRDCITLFDSEGFRIPLVRQAKSGKLVYGDRFDEVLEPGTYYVRVDNFDQNGEKCFFTTAGNVFIGRSFADGRIGKYIEFSWK